MRTPSRAVLAVLAVVQELLEVLGILVWLTGPLDPQVEARGREWVSSGALVVPAYDWHGRTLIGQEVRKGQIEAKGDTP